MNYLQANGENGTNIIISRNKKQDIKQRKDNIMFFELGMAV